MVSVAEAAGSPQSQQAADLAAGLSLLSANETVTFARYNRYVLPFDGFVFWVNAAITNPTATNNSIVAQGALHISKSKIQDGTESYSLNKVVFTTTQPLHENFNAIGPTTIYIGSVVNPNDGAAIRFAFSDQGAFFQQAGLHHYSGDAIYAPLASQIIDDVTAFDGLSPVVSNSLAVWLSLNTYFPPYPGFMMPAGLTLYPSFLVPSSSQPPYGVVHIPPEATEPITSPFLDRTLGHWQSAMDRVRVTLYGLNQRQAADFLDFVLQYSEDTSNIGMMNIPVIRDEKLKQNELGLLAQKKTIDFEVSYQQTTLRNVARALIGKVIVGYVPPSIPIDLGE